MSCWLLADRNLNLNLEFLVPALALTFVNSHSHVCKTYFGAFHGINVTNLCSSGLLVIVYLIVSDILNSFYPMIDIVWLLNIETCQI